MSKENFREAIENMKLNNMQNNLTKVLEQGIEENVVYNALRGIYLIALNAPKFRMDQGMAASFQYTDMDYVVVPVNVFVNDLISKGINRQEAIKKCFEILEEYYNLSASSEEYSSKSGVVRDDDYNKLYGKVGTYYNFNEIPKDSWDFIKDYIIKKIES